MSGQPQQSWPWRDLIFAVAVTLTVAAQVLTIEASGASPVRIVLLAASVLLLVIAVLRAWSAWRRRRSGTRS